MFLLLFVLSLMKYVEYMKFSEMMIGIKILIYSVTILIRFSLIIMYRKMRFFLMFICYYL